VVGVPGEFFPTGYVPADEFASDAALIQACALKNRKPLPAWARADANRSDLEVRKLLAATIAVYGPGSTCTGTSR